MGSGVFGAFIRYLRPIGYGFRFWILGAIGFAAVGRTPGHSIIECSNFRAKDVKTEKK
jgi:hypothetical protein